MLLGCRAGFLVKEWSESSVAQLFPNSGLGAEVDRYLLGSLAFGAGSRSKWQHASSFGAVGEPKTLLSTLCARYGVDQPICHLHRSAR